MECVGYILLFLLMAFVFHCVLEWLTLPRKIEAIEEQLKRIADKLEG